MQVHIRVTIDLLIRAIIVNWQLLQVSVMRHTVICTCTLILSL